MKDQPHYVAFFDGTYREGLELLESARDYLADPDSSAFADQRAVMQLVVSCETMRLTARMAQIMSWLLMQRALFAGEVTLAEASRPENRLGSADVCGVRGPWIDTDIALPDRLRELLDSSLDLYSRIARLDEMMGLRAEAALATESAATAFSFSGPSPGNAS
jgi:regulator of CtrA degradation